MLVSLGLENLPKTSRPRAVAIGNFDGVHLGHRQIISVLLAEAGRDELIPTVLTFNPHPEKVLGKRPLPMIDTLGQRFARLEGLGIETTVVIPFDRTFAGLSSSEFVIGILVGRLQAKKVVAGETFRFGKHRSGDHSTLARLGREYGFKSLPVPPVIIGGRTVSSTAIRSLLKKGAVDEASLLLGRKYEISGQVTSGDSRGEKLGFPTANLLPENEIRPPGVYITETVIDGQIHPSVTFIGKSSTFDRRSVTIETHILDFNGNLLGACLTLRLLAKIRSVRKFRTPQALAAQVARDVEQARAYFKAREGEAYEGKDQGQGHGRHQDSKGADQDLHGDYRKEQEP